MSLDLEAIKARCEAATKGPWEKYRPSGEYVYNHSMNFNVCMTRRSYDAEFIAHAREDVPALVAEVERLTVGIKEIGEQCAKRHDKIKQLEKQLAKYRDIGTPKEILRNLNEGHEEVFAARERISELESQLLAAVEDLSEYPDRCLFCKSHVDSEECANGECKIGEQWVWRGPQEGEPENA